MMKRFVCAAFVAATVSAATPAHSQAAPPPPAAGQQPPAAASAKPQSEWDTAVEAARKVWKTGPATVALAGQGTMELPAGFIFVPTPEASRLMTAQGNSPGADLAGVIYPTNSDPWLAIVRYINAGYIKDDDAKSWNADELLDSLKRGTEESNEQRTSRGIPALEVRGWVEKPAYDAASHRLVWSALAVEKGADAKADGTVNYNTYALGREGYFSLNFVTDQALIENEKPIARQLLGAIRYDAGKSYADFNSSTDRVAEYGLAALIGGVAAKKLGLLAVLGAFFVKFAKIIALGALGVFGGLAKLFRRKKSDETA